jgi:hypothetical protein
VPRDHWLEPEEKQAIISYAVNHPLESYRRLTLLLMDTDVAAVAPATTYRLLKKAGLTGGAKGQPWKKGTGFIQRLPPHENWQTGFSYLNIGGTCYFRCCVPDDCSRAIPAWGHPSSHAGDRYRNLHPKAREVHPEARPRSISDQGPQ